MRFTSGQKRCRGSPRTIHHRQAKDRAWQLGVTEDGPFHGNLVVVVVEPAEHVLKERNLRRRIRRVLRAERRVFRERYRLERALLEPMEHAARTVDVHAAERDDACRDPAHDGHELLRLGA
jgi:hypothetical protein